ncbi:MAG: Spy/CpxP family protein refolding chaperone [Salinivirgaceae bacterium]|nr:Spy/CpxP family protein refolding chaperone [Salinivirgaceae bacterium]
MKNLKLTSLLVSALFISTATLNAQNFYNCDGQGNGRQKTGYQQNSMNRGEYMANLLELSDEQKEKIESLRLNHQKQILPLKNELGEKQAKMRTLNTAENTDTKAINALIDEMGVIKTKMAKIRAAHKQDVRSTLTSDQRVIYDSHIGRKGQRGNRGQGHKGNRGNNCRW